CLRVPAPSSVRCADTLKDAPLTGDMNRELTGPLVCNDCQLRLNTIVHNRPYHRLSRFVNLGLAFPEQVCICQRPLSCEPCQLPRFRECHRDGAGVEPMRYVRVCPLPALILTHDVDASVRRLRSDTRCDDRGAIRPSSQPALCCRTVSPSCRLHGSSRA